MRTRKVSCDVLIIGCGSAGLRAAIEAKDRGADVLVVSKSRKGDPHTVLATGGINAALGTMDPQDSWQLHAADTIRDGRMINDPAKVEILCRDAPRAVMELVKWGARFHREKNGKVTQRFFGAATYRRACFYGDYTGREMIRVLMGQARKRRIKFMDDVYVTKILKRGNRAVGALGADFGSRSAVVFQSKCVILAGGGYSRIYSVSSSRMDENYGEGNRLALDAGAELVDMEMVQFHPTGMVWPKEAVGILVTEAVRGEGGLLFNSRHERFMERYEPERMELSPRDEVARANYSEIVNGRGTRHGGVLLDISHVPKERILRRLPRMYRQFRDLVGIDISRQPMEVAPTAHYSMGGVKADDRCRTRVENLLVAGEAMGQVHGGNRLGGNSLLGTVVFGRIAGEEAVKISRRARLEDIDMREAEQMPAALRGAASIRSELQNIMWEHAGIVRNGPGLKRALSGIGRLKAECAKGRRGAAIDGGIVESFRVTSALEMAECVVRGALERRESRGAHSRSDFPREDRRWLLNIVCRKVDGRIVTERRRARAMSPKMRRMVGRPRPKSHLLE